MPSSPFSPVIIYHGNCFDGFTAAWCAKMFMPHAEMIPAAHGDPIPYSELGGRDIFMLDFCWPREEMLKLYDLARSDSRALIVLDHHITAQQDMEGLDWAIFDRDKSGAGLTWAYFYPGVPMSKWVAYVQDRDLWRFELEGTREFHAYLCSIEMTLANWTGLAEGNMEDFLREGKSIARYMDAEAEKIAAFSRSVDIEGSLARVVNIPRIQFASELGDHLVNAHPEVDYVLLWAQNSEGTYNYQMRSSPRFDVSVVALRYGGGGHKDAAGFHTVDLLPELAR